MVYSRISLPYLLVQELSVVVLLIHEVCMLLHCEIFLALAFPDYILEPFVLLPDGLFLFLLLFHFVHSWRRCNFCHVFCIDSILLLLRLVKSAQIPVLLVSEAVVEPESFCSWVHPCLGRNRSRFDCERISFQILVLLASVSILQLLVRLLEHRMIAFRYIFRWLEVAREPRRSRILNLEPWLLRSLEVFLHLYFLRRIVHLSFGLWSVVETLVEIIMKHQLSSHGLSLVLSGGRPLFSKVLQIRSYLLRRLVSDCTVVDLYFLEIIQRAWTSWISKGFRL